MLKRIPVGLGMLSSVPTGIAILGGRTVEAFEWKNSRKAILKSRKRYAHFDCRTNLTEVWTYISNPEKISRHSFYPFIHYKQEFHKYSRKKGRKLKERDICYAAHKDSCIFQYYCFLLDELYKHRIREDGIEKVAVAYRTDLGVSNIELAKKAFDFMRENASCYVMIGDFTGFFDNLDHQYLKERWKDLLEVEVLPEDHYAVYKNITKYSIRELEDLLQLNGLTNTEVGRRRLNEKTRVLTEKQFHENRSHIRKNLNSFGIPQGSPISALLANIYMLVVDKRIKESVDILHGLYMRYSDDFVIVLPGIGGEAAKENFHKIMNEFNDVPGLTLQPEKTQFFSYDGEKIENCGKLFFVEADCGHKFINFLGFTFDGSHISIRSKTTSKYYYRMQRKAKTILKTKQHQPNTLVGSQNLYKQYSERGSYGKKGNFLTYVRRAKKVFGSKEKIDRDTKRHMQKIRQAMTKERNRK